MQYKLNGLDAVKVIFLSKNIFMTAIFMILFIMPILIFCFVIPSDDVMVSTMVFFTVFIPGVLFTFNNFQSGWRIDGEFFTIKAFTIAKKLKISSMNIGIVEANGEWSPILRIWGAGFPGLLMGRCHLKNGKNAVVFRHLHDHHFLIIKIENDYYLIGHPGIENLYDEFIRLGAKESSFEHNELV